MGRAYEVHRRSIHPAMRVCGTHRDDFLSSAAYEIGVWTNRVYDNDGNYDPGNDEVERLGRLSS